MTLKEKFENVEIMFESQIGSLKYDELSEASNQCEKIADEFAIEFAEWAIAKNMGVSKFTLYEGEVEIFKKEKGL